MITAEDGCVCNFNLEYEKNNSRNGNINPSRIPSNAKDNLLKRMHDIIRALKI